MLSLESFSSLYFPDGRARHEFRKELLDSGITPEQIAWLEEDAAEEMAEWPHRKEQIVKHTVTILAGGHTG